MQLPIRIAAVALALLSPAATQDRPESPHLLTIPAFCGYAHPDPGAVRRDRETGAVSRCEGELRYYFELASPGDLKVTLLRSADAPAANVELAFGPWPSAQHGKVTGALPAGLEEHWLGTFGVEQAGVQRVVLRNQDGTPLRGLLGIRLEGAAAAGAKASTVERRNASSVHLRYEVPEAQREDVEWFYCELTPTTDPLWTYYMATGWRRGYFGMQVNGPRERRVIFSVWDAGEEPVDRDKVAAEDRVELIAKGDGVHASGFGNEGTGGHSHLVHDWMLGDTLRFAVRAEADRDGGTTTYTGWFSHVHGDRRDAPDPWRLVASFRAPKDGRLLRGLYSFSENFSGANGDALRRCYYGNAWARTAGGVWLQLTKATFTHDRHGQRLRMDRRGGADAGRFFLEHGDFTVPPMRYGTKLEVAAPTATPPTLPK